MLIFIYVNSYLGGIFDQAGYASTLRAAVLFVNQKSILPPGVQLEALPIETPVLDSFSCLQHCKFKLDCVLVLKYMYWWLKTKSICSFSAAIHLNDGN